ncbi:hypothetical protein N7454_005249 [Penicillium verhagenii]|nr:hypothetical protein N7454_005249 [Penicillium verhagenii]
MQNQMRRSEACLFRMLWSWPVQLFISGKNNSSNAKIKSTDARATRILSQNALRYCISQDSTDPFRDQFQKFSRYTRIFALNFLRAKAAHRRAKYHSTIIVSKQTFQTLVVARILRTYRCQNPGDGYMGKNLELPGCKFWILKLRIRVMTKFLPLLIYRLRSQLTVKLLQWTTIWTIIICHTQT